MLCPNKSQHDGLWHSQHLFRWPNVIPRNHSAPPPPHPPWANNYTKSGERKRNGMWITLINKKTLFPWHGKIVLSQKRWTYGYKRLTIGNSATCCEAPNEPVLFIFTVIYFDQTLQVCPMVWTQPRNESILSKAEIYQRENSEQQLHSPNHMTKYIKLSSVW